MDNSLQQERSVEHAPHTRTSHFPPKINNALALLAGRVGECSHLSRDARILLCEYVRVLDKNDACKSARVSNSELSRALELSVRTICRLKAELEEEGWITRHQVQSRELGMQITDVSLTAKAINALGLSTPRDIKGSAPAWDLKVPKSLTYLLDVMTCAEVVALMSLCKRLKTSLQDFLYEVSKNSTTIKNHFSYYRSVLARKLQMQHLKANNTVAPKDVNAADSSQTIKNDVTKFRDIVALFDGKSVIVSSDELRKFSLDIESSTMLVEESGQYNFRILKFEDMRKILAKHCI